MATITSLSLFPDIGRALDAETQNRNDALNEVHAALAVHTEALAAVDAAAVADIKAKVTEFTEGLSLVTAEAAAQGEALAALSDQVKPIPASVYVTESGLIKIGTSSTAFVPLGLYSTLTVQPGSSVVVWPKLDVSGSGEVRVTRDGVESKTLDPLGRGLAMFEALEAGEHTFSLEWRALRDVIEVVGNREMLMQEVLK
ncbi:MAG: hypothetical protein ACOYBO_01140 [Azonexus sp.]|jgi:hypothetical protein